MAGWIGSFDTSSIIDMPLMTTVDSTGLPTAVTSGSICVRRSGQTVLAPAGMLLSTSGGQNFVRIFTGSSTTYFVTAADYDVYFGNGTVSSISIIGYPLGQFSIRNRAVLYPTTAARTLSVGPSGTVDLSAISGATVSSTSGVMNVNTTQWMGQTPLALSASQVQAVIPTSATIATVTNSVNANLTTWVGVAPLALSASQVQAVVPSSTVVASVSGAVGSVTGNVSGNVVGSVASVTSSVNANVTTWVGVAPNALNGGRVDAITTSISVGALQQFFTTSVGIYASSQANSIVKQIADNAGGASLTVQQIVDGVWDEAIASHLDAGSTGESLNSASSAGDPWNTAIPGAYASGKAGNIVGNAIHPTTYTMSANVKTWLGTEPLALSSQQVQAVIPASATVATVTNSVNANLTTWVGVAPLALSASQVQAVIPTSTVIDSVTGAVGSVTGNVGGSVASVTSSVNANLTTWVGVAPNALISKRVDANSAAITVSAAVLTLATGSISSTTFAAGAVDAAALAADAATEIADATIARTLGSESYAADGSVPTLAQAHFMLLSALTQFAVISTSIVCYKLDGTTAALTYSTDSASSPTLRIRTL